MKLVMTLLARDEADIVDAHLRFHLNAGVDFVIVTDHRSQDGTTEILESYARDGHIRLLREDAPRIRQSDWMTRMARLAATEHGADWVINSDADEFWWPRGGSLKDVLNAVPHRFGIVHALSLSFVPRPDDQGSVVERMTVRLTAQAPINDPATSFRPVAKVAHRGDPRVVVGPGNHDISNVPYTRLRGWRPMEILHMPLRSRAQCARKHENTLIAWRTNLRADLARSRRALEEGRRDAYWDRVVVDDATLERGLSEGLLVWDTRLRDALRALSDTSPGAPPRTGVGDVEFRRTTRAEDVAHAVEAEQLDEAHIVRLHRRADEVAARIAKLELEGRARRGRLRGMAGRRRLRSVARRS